MSTMTDTVLDEQAMLGDTVHVTCPEFWTTDSPPHALCGYLGRKFTHAPAASCATCIEMQQKHIGMCSKCYGHEYEEFA